MMNSAIGNFDNNGVALKDTQTPENGVQRIFDGNPHNVEWCASKIVALEDEIRHLNEVLRFSTTPVVSKQDAMLNELLFLDVSHEDWEKFTQLAFSMLANGASLFELQQRLMGLG